MGNLFILLCLSFGLVWGRDLSGGRIVGGSDAEKGQFPYAAAIKENGKYICMGTIINNKWIVTAMGCVSKSSAGRLKLLVGTNSLTEGGVEVSVSKIVKNPYWNGLKHQNDVALIRTESPLVFDQFVQAIDLQTEDIEELHEETVLSGFGSTSKQGEPSNTLKYVRGRLTEHFECKKAYVLDFVDIFDSMICTEGVVNKGSCMYDTGAPLVMGGKLMGILSFGKPCATGKPDVFQRIPYFANYIATAINNY